MTAWQPTLSPLLPTTWPPDGTADQYAYAWRVEERGSPDHISEPWGRLHVDRDGVVTFERLAETIDDRGQQTRASIMTKEGLAAHLRQATTLEAALMKPVTASALEKLGARAFYEGWATRDAATAWLLREHALKFFEWLGHRWPKNAPVGTTAALNTEDRVPVWQLPTALQRHLWPTGVYAHGGDAHTRSWRVQLDLETGRLCVARANDAGPFSEDGLLLEPDRELPKAAVQRACGSWWQLSSSRPPRVTAPDGGAGEDGVLLIGELFAQSSRALWLSGPAASKATAAEALIAELKKIGLTH